MRSASGWTAGAHWGHGRAASRGQQRIASAAARLPARTVGCSARCAWRRCDGRAARPTAGWPSRRQGTAAARRAPGSGCRCRSCPPGSTAGRHRPVPRSRSMPRMRAGPVSTPRDHIAATATRSSPCSARIRLRRQDQVRRDALDADPGRSDRRGRRPRPHRQRVRLRGTPNRDRLGLQLDGGCRPSAGGSRLATGWPVVAPVAPKATGFARRLIRDQPLRLCSPTPLKKV